MSDVAILAFGAISALGQGDSAVTAGTPGETARGAIRRDDELTRAGLLRPFAARANLGDVEDRATALLQHALGACASDLDRVRPGWVGERIGMVLGTSSGGMRAAERAFASLAAGALVEDTEAASYVGPMARAARWFGHSLDPAILVLGACASSVLAIGLGARCLARGACDIVLVGGFDDVSVFVASGFEVLRATTASPPPRPFRLGRDGMALGEGAAVLALGRKDARARLFVTGFGASSDAVHLTAPDREGRGLARAALGALGGAGFPHVDLVSPHATATAFNDAAEARALVQALAHQRSAPVVHPFKAQIGHTLGAAGALELLASGDALKRGVLPAAAGEGDLDPDAPARLLHRARAGSPRTALKLACAFGGANAALVLSATPGAAAPAPRPVYLRAVAHVGEERPFEALAASTGCSVDHLVRADGLVRLALDSVARLASDLGLPTGAGIVVGSALATVETNALFAARIRERGTRAGEPRRFAYTSPNAVAGECSIAFGLSGPSFTVGGGMHAGLEAIAAGALLIEGGHADSVVIVAVDETGPATLGLGGHALARGAVALLLTASVDGARGRIGEFHLRRGGPVASITAAGHLALLPLLAPRFAGDLIASSPPDVLAVVRVEAV